MTIKVDSKVFLAFDLDDTLYYEVDFLFSAYRQIADTIDPFNKGALYDSMLESHFSGNNTFRYLIEKYPGKNLSFDYLLKTYRHHFPEITLREGVDNLITEVKSRGGKTGIITNGRSITQRNKLDALGIKYLFDEIIISEEFGKEKPDESIYCYLRDKYLDTNFYIFGDNLDNDFITPKRFGWNCIGVRGTRNIIKYKKEAFADNYLPQMFIDSFEEIKIV